MPLTKALPDLSAHPGTDRYAVWWQEQAVVSLDARTLYQIEKAKRATRLAKQESAFQESARLYHARAEADREARARGGRPKGPRLRLVSDPGNALVNALRPYRGDE
jgi:hypothetical protein